MGEWKSIYLFILTAYSLSKEWKSMFTQNIGPFMYSERVWKNKKNYTRRKIIK